MCASGLPPQLSKTLATYLFQFPADGIDKKVVSFLSDLKQAQQLRKIEMTDCQYLSPSLIATLCGGLHASNSMEEVEVTSVSARLLILSNINIVYLLFLIVYCTCNGWRPFLSLHFIMHIYVPCLKLLLC